MTEPPADRAGLPPGLSYRDAGVDVEGKERLLERLASSIRATHSPRVIAGLGAFAGALALSAADAGALVATTDGVGTKTLLARRLRHDAVIGGDIVAHCANDLAAQGARAVAFLDYIAMARLDAPLVSTLVAAMADACRALGVVMLGGETAEMPGVYTADAYDVVGTMIGLAPAEGVITGAGIRPGDRVLGLASTGLHTNGYALARRVLEAAPAGLHAVLDERGTTVAEALLAPHRCYAPAVLALLGEVRVKGIAHITGGGLGGNLRRVLPEGCTARLQRTWPEPPVFAWLRRAGRIPEDEMVATFNLGIGMALVLARHDVPAALAHFERCALPAYEIGEIVAGARGVELA
ncbi:MAG: phosphoribosylformylglycinamidine cyclo-ligase [Armatimonadota bacterium]|nr:phosphoribosylformylglycinamidine cyclo-ligase [Armatimonadota bacterium]MDR7533596.1 phosphoribosylformylglycinamidine cyclo-ligase [Armatimonadota bacterium]MDR7537395.1 phosphoribosylformylglycinamidine cyclo-ligase [Armatimonadota bacterium]